MASDKLRKYLDSALGTALNIKRTLVANYLSSNKKVEKIFKKYKVTFLAKDDFVELIRKTEKGEENLGEISVVFNLDKPEKTCFAIQSSVAGVRAFKFHTTDKEAELLEVLTNICSYVTESKSSKK